MFARAFLLCALGIFGAVAHAEESWWEKNIWSDPNRGYFWYPPDRPPPVKEEAVEEKEKPKSLSDIQSMEELQAELKRRMDKAVLNPTAENMLDFLEIQDFVMDKASNFADMGRRVMWMNPSVNYNARNNEFGNFTTHIHLHIKAFSSQIDRNTH